MPQERTCAPLTDRQVDNGAERTDGDCEPPDKPVAAGDVESPPSRQDARETARPVAEKQPAKRAPAAQPGFPEGGSTGQHPQTLGHVRPDRQAQPGLVARAQRGKDQAVVRGDLCPA